jgi:NAD(P)-dependent dehydrogenase (short-subunit alcohol dehydrogenase family)
MRGLEGKGVLVTGGSSGIGLATVERFLEEGSRVFMCGNDEGEVDGVLGRLAPGRAIAGMACDVSRVDDVAQLVDEAERFLDRIAVLINNAGIARKARFLDIEAVEWDQTIAVNLRGMFLVGQAVARRMVWQGVGGSIVNMASTNALGGEKEFAHYNASKGGVLQLTRTMAVELGDKGIRVNCVCPGFIDTPLNRALGDEEAFRTYEQSKIPLRRRGRPDEIAAVYAFLASDDASFIHGAAIVVDGGQTAIM